MQWKGSKVALIILGLTGIDSKDLTLFAEILKANLRASFCVGREPFRAYCPRRVLVRRSKPEGHPRSPRVYTYKDKEYLLKK